MTLAATIAGLIQSLLPLLIQAIENRSKSHDELVVLLKQAIDGLEKASTDFEASLKKNDSDADGLVNDGSHPSRPSQ